MKNVSIRDLGKRLFGLSLLSIVFLSGASICQAAGYVPGTVNCCNYRAVAGNCASASTPQSNRCELKNNFNFDVTTKWSAAKECGGVPNKTTNNPITLKHWYVSKPGGIGGAVASNDCVLNENLRCNDTVINDTVDDLYAKNPCETEGAKDSFIKSDDLENDLNFNAPAQEFTVVAKSSNSAGPMHSVRIEWTSSADGYSGTVPTRWAHGQTCSGGSCKICRKGTLCSGGYAVIDPYELSTMPNGKVNKLWFRVILTDGNMKSVTLGDDTAAADPFKKVWTSGKGIPLYLDKVYEMGICNVSGCSKKCTGAAPSMTNATVDTSKCSLGQPYTFNWTVNHPGQTEFLLNVYDSVTHAAVLELDQPISSSGTSYSYTPPSSTGLYVGTGGKLQPNHTYTWEIRVKDNASPIGGMDCKQWSDWMTGPSFTTCSVGPGVSCTAPAAITVNPSTGTYGSVINYSATVNGTGLAKYEWVTGSGGSQGIKPYSGGTINGSETLPGSGNSTETIQLIMRDSSNNVIGTCTNSKTINITSANACNAVPTMNVPATGVYGTAVNFSGSVTGTGIASYQWKNAAGAIVGSGSFTGGTVNGNETLPTSGVNETIQLLVKDAGGTTLCTGNGVITLGPPPCANNIPLLTPVPVVVSPNFCATGNTLPYEFYWNFNDNGDGDGQATYNIKVWETANPSVVHTASGGGQNSFTAFPGAFATGGNLAWNTTYDWQVQVTDNNPTCPKTSVWTSGNRFTTPAHPYPIPAFTILDSSSPAKDCTTQNCNFMQDIHFNASSSTTSQNPVSYKWYLDGSSSPSNTNVNFDQSFTGGSGTGHSVKLEVSDGSGYTCPLQKNFNFSQSNAMWNEIVPKQ